MRGWATLSRYNSAHSRLFAGVEPPTKARVEPLRRSFVVELRRHVDARARFHLDATDMAELQPVVGDHLECELTCGHDDLNAFSVDVYAVHPHGFVDVNGFTPIASTDGWTIRLRLWPAAMKEWK